MVRVPDTAGQLRNAPLRLLRGFFSGIGQFLLAADRLHDEGGRHERLSEDDQLDRPTGLDGVSAVTADEQLSIPVKRSFDATGNVRLLTADDPAETLDNIKRPKRSRARRSPGRHRAGAPLPAPTPAGPTPTPAAAMARPTSTGPAPTPAASMPRPTSTGPAPAPAAAMPAQSATATSAAEQADLLMPGFESLSLPSIRARLRGLDQAQVRLLLACEKSGANRAEIVTLFERRIAKLKAADPDAT